MTPQSPCPDDPQRVLDDPALSRDDKIACLRQLEYDARERMVAEEESGIVGDPPAAELLERILAALHQLGAGVDTEHTPPTKHGGV